MLNTQRNSDTCTTTHPLHIQRNYKNTLCSQDSLPFWRLLQSMTLLPNRYGTDAVAENTQNNKKISTIRASRILVPHKNKAFVKACTARILAPNKTRRFQTIRAARGLAPYKNKTIAKIRAARILAPHKNNMIKSSCRTNFCNSQKLHDSLDLSRSLGPYNSKTKQSRRRRSCCRLRTVRLSKVMQHKLWHLKETKWLHCDDTNLVQQDTR